MPSNNHFGVFLGVFVMLIILGLTFAAFLRDSTYINEMTCYRHGVEIKTTMHELRKPGPYVIGETATGRVIAIAKDGIRCSRG